MNKHEVLAKYAKKFASKSSVRPLLEGIHYGKDGTAFVTDAHFALRIKDIHQFPNPLTLHATTGAPIDGTYPDLNKVFPSSFQNEIPISRSVIANVLLRARCAADVASRISKKAPTIMLTSSNGAAYMQIKNEEKQLELSAFLGNAHKVEDSQRSLNAEYLYTALSIFNDMGSDLVIKISSPLTPIVLTDEKDIDVLILPYRVGSQ